MLEAIGNPARQPVWDSGHVMWILLFEVEAGFVLSVAVVRSAGAGALSLKHRARPEDFKLLLRLRRVYPRRCLFSLEQTSWS